MYRSILKRLPIIPPGNQLFYANFATISCFFPTHLNTLIYLILKVPVLLLKKA